MNDAMIDDMFRRILLDWPTLYDFMSLLSYFRRRVVGVTNFSRLLDVIQQPVKGSFETCSSLE